MSRLRRLVLSDRYFFVTCNLLRTRNRLDQDDFEILARVIEARREEHGFLLTAWVFLPDHWHAVLGIPYPKTIPLVMESIKVSSTRQMNRRRKESGPLWQGRFFDRALRTVKDYNETVEYLHWNPVQRGLVQSTGEWPWSSYRDYAGPEDESRRDEWRLEIDRASLPADAKARI